MSTDPEVGGEKLDPAIEQSWELLGNGVESLVYDIADRLHVEPERVRQLGVISLYYQLKLQRDGRVVIVSDAATTALYSDPLAALAAQDESGLFTQLLSSLRGDSGPGV